MDGIGVKFPVLEKGMLIGNRYRIIRTIGQGGMGVVYAVEDTRLEGMLRAMKVTAAREGQGAFSEEANTLMRLRHPYLPLITDYFPPDSGSGVEMLVMDYIDGDTISAMMSQSLAAFTFPEIIHIGLGLCSALNYLHTLPSAIIHRDLKPSNVMIDRKGQVKLIDFGISRRYKEGKLHDTVKLGTAGFAAPEQQQGKQSDARTDIYGLGALLYFIGSNGSVLSQQWTNTGKAPLLNQLSKHIPASFRTLLERMLQPLPDYRYQSMKEVEQALRAFSNHAQVTIDEPKRWDNHMDLIKPPLVSVLSLSPGAGATMLSITLAIMLGRKGHTVTAAEYYNVPPEWLELLPSKSKKDQLEDEGITSFTERFIRRKSHDNCINWLTVNSHCLEGNKQDERLFDQKLRQFGSAVNIIDFSSQWQDSHAMYWLRQSKHIIVIADPFISRWQVGQLQKLKKIQEEVRVKGGAFHWVANKDVRFSGRREWLSLFPERPLAAVPLLPQDAVLNALWGSKWVTDNAVLDYRISRALLPVYELITQNLKSI
ncbi:serine/threonine-protein kinase [Paenibacillus sp. L3-i20]|uniref:serine/threonine-protein kinase n=1 Tax=Paenibacillus sp. L3-i20 TaxID=2905833 RepID=UPI001EE04066|nr:serine/threonine-protein kinase [Paenibacillus sp. L3-i20]GKU79261.1 hypothetical protein L3i20_v236580 [Paenibacillus sp. L3-i20]